MVAVKIIEEQSEALIAPNSHHNPVVQVSFEWR